MQAVVQTRSGCSQLQADRGDRVVASGTMRWPTRLIILAWCCWALAGCGQDLDDANSEDTDTDRAGRPVAAIELAHRDLSREVQWVAQVESRHRVRVATRVAGILEAVRVEEGDSVARGDLLARLDTRESSAELARAAAEETYARTELAYMEQLRASDSISRNELEQAQTALAVAEAERRLWQARVDFAEIRAPAAGVVTARHVEVGESADSQQLLFELVDLAALVVRPHVSERDRVQLKNDAEASVRFDALPEASVTARVRRIFPAADGASRLFPVEFELPADVAETGVRPGFLARIRLQLDRRLDVIAVPAAAIGEDEDGRYVYVIADDVLKQRLIEPGVTRGQWTEVRSGLEAGEFVLASNPINMRAGERVRIVGWRG